MINYKRYFSFFRNILSILGICCFAVIQTGCSNKTYGSKTTTIFTSKSGIPDYSDLDYWAALPFRKNPSDSIPKPLRDELHDELADVFFIHPTTYVDNDKNLPPNASIDDAKLNTYTDNSTILYQASVFNKHCRIFAPRYRQANLRVFFENDQTEKQRAFDMAYQDIKKAFEYYLSHYNNGRPIIIASHSQGTLHAGRLLKEFFDGKPLSKQLVCAYIIGLPVPVDFFTTLKPCYDSLATGCIISWRSFKEGYISPIVNKETVHSIVINPLTWTTGTEDAPASLNKGGVLRNFNKITPNVVSARVYENILWTSLPRFFGNIFLRSKNYHIADYNLFYMNIRENAGTRIHSFIKNKYL